jgi:hypothetical protein
MATIDEVFALWNNLNFDQLVDDSIKENEAEIVDAQVDQMRHGIAADGEPIGELRDPFYAQAKKAMGGMAEFGAVDLYNEGEFTKGIHLVFDSNLIIPESTNWKNDELILHYGERIFGLTDINLNNVIVGSILPSLQSKLHEAVGLS